MLTRLWLPDLLCSARYWSLVIVSILIAAYWTSHGPMAWLSALAWGGLMLVGLSPITTALSWRLPPSLSRPVVMPLAYGLFAIGCLGLRWGGVDLLWSTVLITVAGWGISWQYCCRFKKTSPAITIDSFAMGFVALWSGIVLVLLRPLLRSVALSLTGQGPLLGWSDMVLLANFVLQLGAPASSGELIPNPLLNSEAVLPYHFSSYMPAALAYRLGMFGTPLEAAVAIAVPLGLVLIGCSLAGVGRGRTLRRRLLGSLVAYTMTVGAYGLFLAYHQNGFWDPAWLLMTAPSTIHAAAMVSSFLALYSQVSSGWIRSGLVACGWLLTLSMKIQVAWYTLPMYGALFCASIQEVWISRRSHRQRSSQMMHSVMALGAGLLAAAILMGGATELSGHGRNYGQDFTQLGLQVAQSISFLEPLRSPLNVSPDMSITLYHVVLAAISQGAIAGFSFWAGLIFIGVLSFRMLDSCGQSSLTRLFRAGVTLLVGSFIATLLAPTTPWDPAEFQNRAWPVLWIAAMQFWISGMTAQESLTSRSRRSRQRLPYIWLFAAVLVTVLMTYQASRVGKSQIQTPLMQGAEAFYPLEFTPESLAIAATLQQPHFSATPPIFVYPLDTKTVLNDQAAILAALSGRLPYYSRLAMVNVLYSADEAHGPTSPSGLPESIVDVLPTAQSSCPVLNGQVRRVELDAIGAIDIVCVPLPWDN